MIGAAGRCYETAGRTPSRRDPRRRCGGLLAADGGGRGRDARTPQDAPPRTRRPEDQRAPRPSLQHRLSKELALAGITTIAADNRWLAETYWPAHNAASRWRRRRPAALSSPTAAADCATSCASRRNAGSAMTIPSSGALTLQIPPSPLRRHLVRAMLRVHEYPDGRLASFHGPHRLADYDPQGKLCDSTKLAA